MPHVLLGGGLLLLGLLVAGGPGRAWAQADSKPPIMVPINGTVTVQMSKKQVIAEVVIEKEDIVQGIHTAEPNRLTLRGQRPGITKVTLIAKGAERETEVIEVIVQQDIELLRNLLQRAVPTANVTPIPGAGNTIILTGWVARAEDIDVVTSIARTFTAGAAGAAGLVNAVKVGGVMQVQLDVVVARVARQHLRRLAFDLSNSGNQHLFNSVTGGNFIDPAPGQSITGGGGQPLQIPNIVGSPNNGSANFFLGIFTTRQLFLIWLQALRDNSLAKLLAEPRLVTLSGRPAEFTSGGQQAVPVVAGLGGTAGVTFIDFGTTLSFLPVVLGNGRIYLEVEPAVSALDNANGTALPGGGFVAGRLLQRVRTSVEIEDGQTLAIGGLIQNTVQADSSRVPVLGDIPYIGAPFTRMRYQVIEEELIVLVTPHLVDPMDCTQVPQFLPGQETRTPDDFELFLEGILEAPRGQRKVCPDRRYLPAYKNSPTMQKYPCCNDPHRDPYGPFGPQGPDGVNGGGCAPGGCPAVFPAETSGAPVSSETLPLPARQDVVPAPQATVVPMSGPAGSGPVVPQDAVPAPQATVVPMSGPAGSGPVVPPERLPTLPPAAESSDASR